MHKVLGKEKGQNLFVGRRVNKIIKIIIFINKDFDKNIKRK